MHRFFVRALAALVLGGWAAAGAAQERIVFATDWLAQAEHGATTRRWPKARTRSTASDVTIRMGGPQVNGLQLLAAGQLDVAMADGLQVLSAIEQDVPLTTIAATFRRSDRADRTPGVAKIEDLKGKPIAIAAAANTTFWPWLKQKYGFSDDQKRPYGFSVQPFLADPKLSQQGFATSEPYSIEKAGVKPVVFLLADLATALLRGARRPPRRARAARRRIAAIRTCVGRGLEELPRQSGARQRAHPQGQSGNERGTPGIRRAQERENAIVDGGDAKSAGLLTMTDARWKATVDFLRSANLAKSGTDYTKAWTLDVVKNVRVLP